MPGCGEEGGGPQLRGPPAAGVAAFRSGPRRAFPRSAVPLLGRLLGRPGSAPLLGLRRASGLGRDGELAAASAGSPVCRGCAEWGRERGRGGGPLGLLGGVRPPSLKLRLCVTSGVSGRKTAQP